MPRGVVGADVEVMRIATDEEPDRSERAALRALPPG